MRQALVSSLITIATRTWTPPEGASRDERLEELRNQAAGRTDALAEAAGILLGTRPDDEHDPRHVQQTAAVGMLLEVAGVEEDDERVQRAVAVGRERRERNRVRPAPERAW